MLTTWRHPLVRALLLATWVAAAKPVLAQGYYNLEAGRPLRIDDATSTPLYEVDFDVLPVRFEQFATGARRWRADPKVSVGIAPFTELDLRIPMLLVDPHADGVARISGLGGVAIGALHAFGVEGPRLPAFAVAGEWVAPTGPLAAHTGSYSAKLIATRTFEDVRLHANVSTGTWSVRDAIVRGAVICPRLVPPGVAKPPGCGSGAPSIPDTPCSRATFSGVSSLCASNSESTAPAQETDLSPTVGSRWAGVLGLDHAFPLASTLLAVDVVAERFIGLYDFTDLSAEVGIRHQLTPQYVVDLGIARHFVGTLRSNAIIAGMTYSAPVRRSAKDGAR